MSFGVKGEQSHAWLLGKRPEATAEVLQDGWMATGDIVIMDESYSLRIVDRKKRHDLGFRASTFIQMKSKMW